MKISIDCHRQDVEYKVGDFVYVKLQPYRQHSLRLFKNKKLSMKYFGLFPILEYICTVAYKLFLSPSSQIHPVFHASVLKRCEGQPPIVCIAESLLLNKEGCPLQPQFIRGNHMIKKNDEWQEEILIQWQGLTPKEAT